MRPSGGSRLSWRTTSPSSSGSIRSTQYHHEASGCTIRSRGFTSSSSPVCPRFVGRAGKEGFSIPAQLRLLHEYAAYHQIQIVEEFVDVETAKKAGRTNFN